MEFVKKARAWCTTDRDRDIETGSLALDLIRDSNLWTQSDVTAADAHPLHYSPTTPPTSSFSSDATPVVPLVASRIALPDCLTIIPVERVLPPHLARLYCETPCPSLLRPPLERLALDQLHPLRRPRIAGTRSEYVALIGRMVAQGMVAFTDQPKAVNGVFAVAKDDTADRLIIDAQPANRLFVDSPHVSLPGPAHLAQLEVPHGATMFVGKSDLSNFYHHLGLPRWMQPYFALPPLTPAELARVGAPLGAAFPMCTTTPMGFSHAVMMAQAIHEHVVYSNGALRHEDSVLQLCSPAVTRDRCVHGIVIDDLFLFSLDQTLAEQQFTRVLAAYQRAGFVVKLSKVTWPTSAPVKVIGFDIDGAQATIHLPADSQLSLFRSTLSLLRSPSAVGTLVAHVVGKWTWVMMLRRPSLAVLQHVYRFIRTARGRRFNIWPSVRRELHMLLTLLPLLYTDLRRPFHHRAFASDASELAAGVVSTPLSAALHGSLWPLCSSRHHATLQARLNSDAMRQQLGGEEDGLDQPPSGLDSESHARLARWQRSFDTLYSRVGEQQWRVDISTAWRDDSEHINVLELRAALLTLHRILSSPSSHSSRVYLLLDSAVAFFSLWKGRSSSPSLLLVLRKISALLLSGDLTLLMGWLPSAVNPADAPSRLVSA